MPPKAKAAVYGPFDITSKVGQEGISFLDMPYSSVQNSQILVSVTDNATQAVIAQSQPDPSYGMILTELSVWGSVQGYLTLLKRQAVKSTWGPMMLRLGDSDAFSSVSIRGRLFIGGKSGIPVDMVFVIPLKVEAVVHVQPREGLGY